MDVHSYNGMTSRINFYSYIAILLIQTRVIAVSCGIKISPVHHFVLSQYTRLTDRRTDRRTELRQQYRAMHYIQSHCKKKTGLINLEEKVPIIEIYCHLWPPDMIALGLQLNILWGFESELQTNPMPFHLQWMCGATLMPMRGCAMDWDGTK